jgi:triacylglycerol esterase/lipase EstA (alpha/beta hydrolase family)
VLTLLALVAVGVAVVAAVLVGGRPVESRGAEPGPPAELPPGPVLLVPGYGGSVASVQPLADRLTAAGRDATVVPLPGDGTGDLREAADALGAAAAAALGRTGADSVDVVGYSAGGLVARLWAADGGAELARRVVTLGSPHHGTGLAALASNRMPERCPVSCQQMVPGSELLTELNAGDETPEGPDWISIWTTQDAVVTPTETARLDGALNLPVQEVCADAQVDHHGLPAAPLVQAMVVEQLAGDDPVELDAGDCSRLGG